MKDDCSMHFCELVDWIQFEMVLTYDTFRIIWHFIRTIFVFIVMIISTFIHIKIV